MGFEKKGFVGNERRGGVFRKRERGQILNRWRFHLKTSLSKSKSML